MGEEPSPFLPPFTGMEKDGMIQKEPVRMEKSVLLPPFFGRRTTYMNISENAQNTK